MWFDVCLLLESKGQLKTAGADTRKELCRMPHQTVRSAVSFCVWSHFDEKLLKLSSLMSPSALLEASFLQHRARRISHKICPYTRGKSWAKSLVAFLSRVREALTSLVWFVLFLRMRVQNNSETVMVLSFLRMHVYQNTCHHPTQKNSQMWSLPLMKAWV